MMLVGIKSEASKSASSLEAVKLGMSEKLFILLPQQIQNWGNDL